MSRLKELIKELCPNGVEFKKINEVCNVTIGEFIHKNLQSDNAEFPVFNGGISNTGYYKDYNNTENKIIVSARGANAGFVNKVTTKYWAGNSCYTIDVISKKLDWNFVFYYLKNNQNKLLGEQQTGSIPAISKKQIEEFFVPVPPLEVQHEIVHILDDYTLLSAELSAELKARKKQYKYYRDKLLKNNKNKVEIKTLDDVCNISAGGDVPKENFSKEKNEKYNIPIISNGVGKNALYGYTDIVKIDKKAVTIAARGTIGYAEYRDYSYYPIIRLISAVPKNENELNTKFLYYSLQGRKYDVPTTGIPQLTVPTFKKEKISIPEIKIQEKIVEVLDNFKKICSDLKIGLPAEIEARQKQYEFYRDTLLTYVATGEIILQDKTRQDKTSNN